MTSENISFEQMCVRKKRGFVCDEPSVFKPQDPETFDEIPLKLTSKTETSLLLLKTYSGALEKFTIIAFPYYNSPTQIKGRGKRATAKSGSYLDCIEETWKLLDADNWDGLQVISLLTKDSIPNNGARMYSLKEFSTSLMDCLRAYFMFQKPTEGYNCSELTSWKDNNPDMVFLAVIWKMVPQESNPLSRPFVISKTQVIEHKEENLLPKPKRLKVAEPAPVLQRKGRSTRQALVLQEDSDEEVTFKNCTDQLKEMNGHSLHIPAEANRKVTRTKVTSKSTITRVLKPVEPKPEVSQAPDATVSLPVQPSLEAEMTDVTLGFEQPNTISSRKSLARKSLAADWPENEKEQILELFDNLNPAMSEQTKIALTCKFVIVQFEKELTSKILYTWIQKKGRKVYKKQQSFELPEDKQKDAVLSFFRTLNPAHSETTRAAFAIKYFQAQYGIKVSSKQLLSWINEKPGKKTRRR